MSVDAAPFVIAHDLDATQKTAASGTETLIHDCLGPSRFGIALRFKILHTNDKLSVAIGTKIPGRSTDSDADDYFEDHTHFTYSVGGPGSGAGNTFAVGATPHQKVFVAGAWWATPGDWIVKYTWDVNTASSDLMAVRTWTLSAGGY